MACVKVSKGRTGLLCLTNIKLYTPHRLVSPSVYSHTHSPYLYLLQSLCETRNFSFALSQASLVRINGAV